MGNRQDAQTSSVPDHFLAIFVSVFKGETMNHDESTDWICDSTFELDALDAPSSAHAAQALPIITLEQGQLPALVDQAERLAGR